MQRASRLKMAAQRAEQGDEEASQSITRLPVAGDRRAKDPWLGKLVDGRYRVDEVLGRGGMGVVYKIKHQRMGKIAAMKVLHNELAQDPEVVERFKREAEAVSRLGHPNTVQVFDFGTEKGALYLVMEYVRGQDLGAIIDRDGPLDFKTLAPLLGQICGSLEEAHALGVVHRDLKPENILVSRTHSGKDFIKVLDFGLAKLSEREDSSSVTSAGSIVGTPYYMSPEQIRADDIDHRADIYSFGALMFRLLTGENAFNAKTPVGVLTKHLTEPLIPPSQQYPGLGIPKEVDKIILRCMAKKPDERYPGVRGLLEDIETLYLEQGSGSSSSDVRQPPTEWLASTHGATATVAALLEDEVDHGIDSQMRLRRGDFDDFEARLKRKRWIRLLVFPLLTFAALGAVAYVFLLRPEEPRTVELEPNNTLGQATLISANTAITGFIGKRANKTSPDRDFYRFGTTPDPNGEVVSISVSSPPNIDISIDLYNLNGTLMKHRDENGVGGEETLQRWTVNKPVVIAISGVLSDIGKSPTENVSDPYSLNVVFSPKDSRLESEPNDSRADANLLSIGTPVSGQIDRKDDVDVFRVDGDAGEYKLLISGADDVPVEWSLDGVDDWKSSLTDTISLKGSALISIRHTLRTEPFQTVLYTIDIAKAL